MYSKNYTILESEKAYLFNCLICSVLQLYIMVSLILFCGQYSHFHVEIVHNHSCQEQWKYLFPTRINQ